MWGDTKLELVEGGPFQLRWRNTDENGDAATLDGTITGIDPPRRLEISADWGSTAAGQPGTRTHLTRRLEPDGDHTLLHFENKVEAPTRTSPPQPAGTCTSTPSPPSSPAATSTWPHPEAQFAPIHQAYTEKYGATPGANDSEKAPTSDSGPAPDTASP